VIRLPLVHSYYALQPVYLGLQLFELLASLVYRPSLSILVLVLVALVLVLVASVPAPILLFFQLFRLGLRLLPVLLLLPVLFPVLLLLNFLSEQLIR
jgi:hypothetical protein